MQFCIWSIPVRCLEMFKVLNSGGPKQETWVALSCNLSRICFVFKTRRCLLAVRGPRAGLAGAAPHCGTASQFHIFGKSITVGAFK